MSGLFTTFRKNVIKMFLFKMSIWASGKKLFGWVRTLHSTLRAPTKPQVQARLGAQWRFDLFFFSFPSLYFRHLFGCRGGGGHRDRQLPAAAHPGAAHRAAGVSRAKETL